MAPPQQRSAYVKCYSCSYAWNYKTNQTCYWCSKALAPWTDSPPPVQGAWAARAKAAAQADSSCTQQPSPDGGWEPWASWPKSRRRRGNGNGKNQEDDWWANKNDTPKARSAEDILAELQAIAPHIDKAAIDGIKSQIPPPQPQKPADLNDIYSRAQATERRCKNNLERLLESEQKALSWYTERKAASEEAAYKLAEAQAEAQAALDALQVARKGGTATPTASQQNPTFNLTSLLEDGDISIEAGSAFDLQGLDIDDSDRQAWESLQQRFATELKAKVTELFGNTASRISQLRAEASTMRTRFASKRQRSDEDGHAREGGGPPPAASAAAGEPPAAAAADADGSAASSPAAPSDEPPAPAAGATSDGSFAAQPVPAINKDPDLEDKAQKMLSQMRKPTATAAAGAQQPL